MPRAARIWAFVLLACIVAGCSPGDPPALKESEGLLTTADGARLFYRKVGSGANVVIAPADLFLYPALRDLASNRTVVFYDMRNRGRSNRVSDRQDNSIQRDVADLEELRAELGVKRFDLIGWSYLGLMAAMYAIEFPEHVRRIVQIGPVPIRYGTKYPPELDVADYFAAMDTTALNELRRLRDEGFHQTHPQEYCEREWAVTKFALVGDPANVDRIAQFPCATPNEWPVRLTAHFERHFISVQELELPLERVAGIRQPVLVMHGTMDRNAPYGGGREWALVIPDSRLLTIEGAAHCPWADEPDLVMSSIRTFLDGEWPPGVENVQTLER